MKIKGIALAALCACLMSGCSSAPANTASTASGGNIDYDLTQMSSTMVYSEVYDMMNDSDKYLGTTVKMDGVCAIYQNPEKTQTYYACIVQDATACCAQGIEFVLKDGGKYPEQDDQITVCGEFEVYEELGKHYCRLKDAEIL